MQGWTTPLGDVVDIDTKGMRVRGWEIPALRRGERASLTIRAEGETIRVLASLAWSRRETDGQASMGFRFTDVTPRIASLIELLATGGSRPRGRRTDVDTAPVAQASLEVADLYAVLGVDSGATPEEIARAFRRRAREIHPDMNPAPDAPEQFRQLHKAYRVLRDPEFRMKYDQFVRRARVAANRKAA
ncbi:MAG: J domain-containing protein [Planctomycetota bacterium]|nr:J domain-containing protein [Planctomycetota bacterium]